MGVEPGLSDVFARYAADELFDEIEEIGVRDGANLTVDGYDFAPSFTIWTTIEECLNPPVVYEADRGWFTTEPFSEPEVFDFPEGIGPVECVNVEHEEVLLVPALGRRAPGHLQVRPGRGVHRDAQDAASARPGPHRPVPCRRRGRSRSHPGTWSPRCLPDPATLGDRMHGKTCAGTWVTGTKDGEPREVYLYHVVDNQWSMAEYGSPGRGLADRRQPRRRARTARHRRLEGQRASSGRRRSPPRPFLDLLTEYGSPWGMREE